MSHDYAMSRVRDALEKSGGNHAKAQRLLLSWLPGDQTLLVGLAGPHLQSIVAHALGHAAASSPKKPLPMQAPKPEDDVPPPGKASQAHVDAIHAIIRAGKTGAKE